MQAYVHKPVRLPLDSWVRCSNGSQCNGLRIRGVNSFDLQALGSTATGDPEGLTLEREQMRPEALVASNPISSIQSPIGRQPFLTSACTHCAVDEKYPSSS